MAPVGLIRRLAGAFVIGFAMVFAPRRQDEHWSVPARAVLVDVPASRAGARRS